LVSLVYGAGMTAGHSLPIGLAVFSAGLMLAGLSIFTFYGCKALTNITVKLTKKFVLWLKGRFVRKETT